MPASTVPELRPFRGLLYNPQAVPDLGAVICPPYDVIDAAQRARLVARDPRNAVHVELPVAPDGDDGGTDTAYEQAGRLFAGWRGDGTLVRDDRRVLSLYEQLYQRSDGSPAACRGFFGRLRLDPPGPASSVRPHERTMAGPKEDRLRLMRALRANLSPVLLLYQSTGMGRAAADLLAKLMARPAERETRADDGVVHRLWRADPADARHAAALLATATTGPFTIADGHHRYATALRFRDEVGGAGADHVLALLYDATSGGLVLEPTHRVVRRVLDPKRLLATLAERFSVRPVDDQAALRAALARGGLAVWLRAGGAWLGPAGSGLAVTALSAAMPSVAGAEETDLERRGRLWYTRDADQALASVDDGSADACFLLSATPVQTVIDHAARGQVMPPKSTYFRPKAATGLVFNPLDE